MTPQRPRLLLVHDDHAIVTRIGTVGMELGFHVASAASVLEMLQHVRDRGAEVIFINVDLPGVPGFDVIHAIHRVSPEAQVILLGDDHSRSRVVQALRLGAADYLSGTIEPGRINALLTAVLQDRAARRTLVASEADIAQRLEFCGLVGRSSAMQQVFDLIRRLAPHRPAALLRGEAGTGKELSARALHQLGPAAASPFIAINCSGGIDTLLERELFGDPERASGNQDGVLEAGGDATVFFDDVADLPPCIQARLQMLLERGAVQGPGSSEWRRVNVQILAATARDLRQEVAAGRFRADLFERLAATEIELPPLRARLEDVPYLSASFVRRFAERFNKPIAGLTPAAERALGRVEWTGNVRQLRNVLERGCILADGEFITEMELADAMGRVRHQAPEGIAAGSLCAGQRDGQAVPVPLSEVQREHIARTLDRVNGNKARAARMLGLSRRAFYRQLERHGLHVRGLAPVRDPEVSALVAPS